ncbi:dehydratase [Mameliella alba]|nr:dehydratase [Mameliella alba]MCA0956756.1 dehydratase [Mameliella alba]
MTATPPPPETARTGDSIGKLTFGPISRRTLALYAGVSLDHNPIHIDIDFARKAGQPDVFAHGMLGMAQFGRLVTGWAGAARISALSARFVAIVPVHAELLVTGTVTDRRAQGDETELELALRAVLQDGTPVLKGSATVHLAAASQIS